jgi:DNA polymerase
MLALDKAGYEIVFHIHDEAVIEVEKENAEASYKRIREIMCSPISWAKGLILNAEGFTSDYYMKD